MGKSMSAQSLYAKLKVIIQNSNDNESIGIEICSGYGDEESHIGILDNVTVKESNGKKTIVLRAAQEEIKEGSY